MAYDTGYKANSTVQNYGSCVNFSVAPSVFLQLILPPSSCASQGLSRSTCHVPQVVLLFLYPTLNKNSARMNQCTEYVVDDNHIDNIYKNVTLLKSDLGTQCVGAEYQQIQTISIIFLGMYGIGIPVMIPVIGWLLRTVGQRKAGEERGRELEFETFAFLFVGFKKEFRYWESVNMFRKVQLSAALYNLRETSPTLHKRLHPSTTLS